MPVVVIEEVAVAFVVRFVGVIGVEDGVGQAAGVSDDRDGTVFEADELSEAAGFVFARNEDDVGTGVNKVGEFFVVSDFEVAIGMIVVTAFEVQKGRVDLAVGTGAEQDKLAASVEAVWNSVKNQVDTLLMVEATDEGNDGAELFSQPEAISKGFFVAVFIIDSAGGITFGDVGVDIGVPDFVIEAVEDAAEFSMVHVEDALQAHAEMAVADFVGVTG